MSPAPTAARSGSRTRGARASAANAALERDSAGRPSLITTNLRKGNRCNDQKNPPPARSAQIGTLDGGYSVPAGPLTPLAVRLLLMGHHRARNGSSCGTKTPGPSNGPRPPTRSSTGSAATAHASQDRDTRYTPPHEPTAYFRTSTPKFMAYRATSAAEPRSSLSDHLGLRGAGASPGCGGCPGWSHDAVCHSAVVGWRCQACAGETEGPRPGGQADSCPPGRLTWAARPLVFLGLAAGPGCVTVSEDLQE